MAMTCADIEDDSVVSITISHFGQLQLNVNERLLGNISEENQEPRSQSNCTVTKCRVCKKKQLRIDKLISCDVLQDSWCEDADVQDVERPIERQKVLDDSSGLGEAFAALSLNGENPAPAISNPEVAAAFAPSSRPCIVNNTSNSDIHSSPRRKPCPLLAASSHARFSAHSLNHARLFNRNRQMFNTFPSAAEYKDPDKAYRAALCWALDISPKAAAAAASKATSRYILGTPHQLVDPSASFQIR